MATEPYMASQLIIGDKQNIIGISYDGSMTLQDSYVPPVRLKDIVGGTVVLDPAILASISPSEWPVSPPYQLSIYHNFGLTSTEDASLSGSNILPIGVFVQVYDHTNTSIAVQSVQCFPNYVIITLPTLPLNTIKVAIKRIS